MIGDAQLQLIGLAALVIILPMIIGLVKHFTAKPDFTAEDREKLNDLYQWHDEKDPTTGNFRWYNSTTCSTKLTNDLTKMMVDIQYGQRELAKNLERMAVVLDKLIDRIDKIEKGS